MRKTVLVLIRAYQYLISPVLGPRCRYHPSCSDYTLTSVERFGLLRGGWLAAKRLARCHPWRPGGYDPVPDRPGQCRVTHTHVHTNNHEVS